MYCRALISLLSATIRPTYLLVLGQFVTKLTEHVHAPHNMNPSDFNDL